MADEVTPGASPAFDPWAITPAVPDVPSAPERDNAWRHGGLLVVVRAAHLPDRCVKCNAPSVSRVRRTHTWHHPLFYLLFLAGPPVYFMVAWGVQRSADLSLGLCAACHEKRQNNIWGGAFLVLAGAGILLLGLVVSGETRLALLAFPISFVVFLIAAIWVHKALAVLAAREIDDHVGRFTKAGPAFLESLPEWPGP